MHACGCTFGSPYPMARTSERSTPSEARARRNFRFDALRSRAARHSAPPALLTLDLVIAAGAGGRRGGVAEKLVREAPASVVLVPVAARHLVPSAEDPSAR
jgi:hypothetical protein